MTVESVRSTQPKPSLWDADVIIVGGGLTGPLLSLALAQGGMTSIVIDKDDVERMQTTMVSGKGYAIALSSRRLLTALGVWPEIEDQTYPIKDILVRDGRVSDGARSAFLHFDHQEIGTEPFGHMAEDHVLRPAILKAVQSHTLITYRDKTSFLDCSVRDGCVEVSLDTGEVLKSKVLLGCDGRASKVAQKNNIKSMTKNYDQYGLVCTISHTKPHNHIAHEYFLPGGPFAILPLASHTSTLVWTEKKHLAQKIQASDDDVYIQAIQDRMKNLLGDVTLTGKRWSYPLSLKFVWSLHKPRVALVGDAAHVIHPIAGQGLNVGIRDVAALSQVLVEAHRRGEDIGSELVLERYSHWRRGDITALSLATDALNTLFSNDIEPVRVLRDMGLSAFNRVPFLRRSAMRFAAGLTGELPLLLQGRSL